MNPYKEAVAALNAGKKGEAEKAFLLLLNNDFDNPVLLFALGMTYLAQRKNGAAYALLKRALERLDDSEGAYERLGVFPADATKEGKRKAIRKQKAECLNGIALCHRYEERKDDAKAIFEQALALTPDDPDLLANIGCMYVNDGRPEGGLRWFRRALEVQPDHLEARWNLGLIQLEMGQWKEGFENYDEGEQRKIAYARTYKHPDGSTLPMWTGERDRSLLVYGEQGIGDEIMFASCLPDLKAMSSKLVLDCHPRLVTLFERSFGLECHGTRKAEWLDWVINHKFGARCAMGTMPRYLRSNGEFPKMPYLKAGRNAVVDALPGFKIGLSWQGGYKETRAALRSVRLAEMVRLLRMDATFISLQYTECNVELDHMERMLGTKIQRFDFVTDRQSDYDLTAEVVNSCDLVISVNTSLVHLCGALGKECWTLTPSKPAWRYGIRGDTMPWYGSVKQFRQARDEPWSAVISRVAYALELRLEVKEIVKEMAA